MINFFHKVIDVLAEEKIPYMLSGSVAMGLYVMPRATRDFDFVVQLEPKDILSFVSHFAEGYYCNISSIEEAIKFQTMFNIIDHQSGYKADFVILKSQLFRQVEFERRQKFSYFEKEVFVVSVEDLLISKLIWIQEFQSSLQKSDIEQLWELENIDKTYIRNWIKELKLNAFGII
ncbi:MAG: hypothetical protein V4683_11755 [Bacteroidota bacterium]